MIWFAISSSVTQMMSSRSGMKLSPMGFPPVMQHIHMGHPMGLGFPLVHAGMGMGMGMGMMDLPHGMDGRPFQALSATSPHFNLAYPVTAPLPSQTCSQPLPSMEVPSSEFWPMQQPPAHVSSRTDDLLHIKLKIMILKAFCFCFLYRHISKCI